MMNTATTTAFMYLEWFLNSMKVISCMKTNLAKKLHAIGTSKHVTYTLDPQPFNDENFI